MIHFNTPFQSLICDGKFTHDEKTFPLIPGEQNGEYYKDEKEGKESERIVWIGVGGWGKSARKKKKDVGRARKWKESNGIFTILDKQMDE